MREIGEIELSIQGGTEEIEALGEAGKVEESMQKLAAVDALKQLKVDKEKELQNLNETAGASGHQKLRVCETCVGFVVILPSLSPVTLLPISHAAHLTKNHAGNSFCKVCNTDFRVRC